MLHAIVYLSGTGHTKQYAEILGRKTGLPVYDLRSAKKELPRGTEIIYLGWLMAGTIKGYIKAAGLFSVKAVCGVGMSGGNSQLSDMKKVNQLPDAMPAFYLQGGFEIDKLHGIYKLMRKTMKATVGKQLSGKPQRTPDEDAMLELLLHGGNMVSADDLSDVYGWFSGQS